MATLRSPAREPVTSIPAAPDGRRPAGLRRSCDRGVLSLRPDRWPGRSGQRPGQLPEGSRARRCRHPAAVSHGARCGPRPRAGGAAVHGADGIPRRRGSRLPGGRARSRARRSSSSSTWTTSTVPGSTARTRSTIPTTHAALPSSLWPPSPRCRGWCPAPSCSTRTTGTPRCRWCISALMADDRYSRAVDRRALGAQPGISGTLSAGRDAADRPALGAVQLAPARVVRQGQLPEGRPGLRRLCHHRQPHPGRRAAHARGRVRPARRLHLAGRPARGRAQRDRPADLGSGHRLARSPPSTRPRIWKGSGAARRPSSVHSDCPSDARCRSSA